MPITFIFACLAMLGVLLLVPAGVAGAVLLANGKKKHALMALSVPVAMIALAVLLSLAVFVAAGWHSRIVSARPNLLFRMTFGCRPPASTRVLKAYHKSLLDGATTVMKFSATRETVDQIATRNFVRCDKETFARVYRGNDHNLPQRVRAWFLPSEENADYFWVAQKFDESYAYSTAILCYSEQAQIAYFHWLGMD